MNIMNIASYGVIQLVILSSLLSTAFSCSCLNNGICKPDTSCACQSGYYGPVCQLMATSYQVTYSGTPNDKDTAVKSLKASLVGASYNIRNVTQIYPGNIFKLMFYQELTAQNLVEIEKLAKNAITTDVIRFDDFDECSDDAGDGKQICYSKTCVNTKGSFTCGCGTDQILSKSKCVAKEDNTKTVIYIWAAVVVAVILTMLAFLIFYRRKKIERGKKLQREIEKKHAARGSLTPTNIDDYDGQMRRSPAGSVFDVSLGGPQRPMSAIYNPDGTSLYSYNSRMYPQSEPDFSRHRLSAPVLENYGYENDVNPNPRSYSVPGSYPSSFIDGQIGIGSIQEEYSPDNIIPTRFPSDMQLVREDRYEPY